MSLQEENAKRAEWRKAHKATRRECAGCGRRRLCATHYKVCFQCWGFSPFNPDNVSRPADWMPW